MTIEPDDLARQALSDLQLSSGASPTEIRHAFARLALKHHPDHNPGDPNATARFQRICRAYEVLTHPRPRRKQTVVSDWPNTWPPWGTPPSDPRTTAHPDPDLKNYPSAADLAWLRRPHPYTLERRYKAIRVAQSVFWIALALLALAAIVLAFLRPDAPLNRDTYPEHFWRQMKRF